MMPNSVPRGLYEYLDIDRALLQVGDLPALDDLLAMLEVSLTRDIPQIEQLLAQKKVFLVNRMLHALKGFLPIFCGDALCDEVAAIEMLSRTGSPADVAGAYVSVSPKLLQLQMDVAQYMGTQRNPTS
jgi:hypothetical protein